MMAGPFLPTFGGNLAARSATLISAYVSAATPYAPPPNALAYIFQAINTNSVNLRLNPGAAANATLGLQFEPGRDSGYIPYGGTLSVCPESGVTCAIQLTWFIA